MFPVERAVLYHLSTVNKGILWRFLEQSQTVLDGFAVHAKMSISFERPLLWKNST
jgi:hypothetical protein